MTGFIADNIRVPATAPAALSPLLECEPENGGAVDVGDTLRGIAAFAPSELLRRYVQARRHFESDDVPLDGAIFRDAETKMTAIEDEILRSNDLAAIAAFLSQRCLDTADDTFNREVARIHDLVCSQADGITQPSLLARYDAVQADHWSEIIEKAGAAKVEPPVASLRSNMADPRDAEIERLIAGIKDLGRETNAADEASIACKRSGNEESVLAAKVAFKRAADLESAAIITLMVAPAGSVHGLLTKLQWVLDHDIEENHEYRCFVEQIVADIKHLAPEVRS